MNQSYQTLIQFAHDKLIHANCTHEQREQTLQLLNLCLELTERDQKNETYAASIAELLSNITQHHDLLFLLQQQTSELEALKRISLNLTSSLQLQAVLDRVAVEAMRLIKHAQCVHLFLYKNGRLSSRIALNQAGQPDQIVSALRDDGLNYRVVREKRIILMDEMQGDPYYKNMPTDWQGSIVGIPLKNDDMIVGVMNVALLPMEKFSPSELRLLDLLANQATIAIINARLHQSMAEEAMSDVLTGLPNRRALDVNLENEVNRAARYGHQFAVLMMDLDGFKAVNDNYGHDVGDQVLKEFARILSETKNASDFLARYGGDELVLIMPEANCDSATVLAERIQLRMGKIEFILPDGKGLRLGISGGIALYPQHAHLASGLLRAADEALYRAKRHARGSFLLARAGTGELPPIKSVK